MSTCFLMNATVGKNRIFHVFVIICGVGLNIFVLFIFFYLPLYVNLEKIMNALEKLSSDCLNHIFSLLIKNRSLLLQSVKYTQVSYIVKIIFIFLGINTFYNELQSMFCVRSYIVHEDNEHCIF